MQLIVLVVLDHVAIPLAYHIEVMQAPFGQS